MRPRLLLLIVVAALAALLSGTSRAGAGAASCTATATGKHVRTQLLKVHLSGTCPASGTAHGTLVYSQWPHIHGKAVFALNYTAGTLWLHVPKPLTMKPAWSAHGVKAALDVSVQASPKRRLHGSGHYSIQGSFKAANGAVMRWKQTVRATPDRVTFGSVHVSARLPGTSAMVISVHEVREFCATNKPCPFGMATSTDHVAYPANYVRATLESARWFATGEGTMRSGVEQTTILLRAKHGGRVLGRSDFQAAIRTD